MDQMLRNFGAYLRRVQSGQATLDDEAIAASFGDIMAIANVLDEAVASLHRAGSQNLKDAIDANRDLDLSPLMKALEVEAAFYQGRFESLAGKPNPYSRVSTLGGKPYVDSYKRDQHAAWERGRVSLIEQAALAVPA